MADNNIIISSVELEAQKTAQERGKDSYFTGSPCLLKKHISKRDVVTRDCLKCLGDDRKRYENRIKKRLSELDSCYYLSENVKAKIPLWADFLKMNQFYIERDILNMGIAINDRISIRYEVDHIIPLNGKTVCGLHVENNLRVVTQKQNRKKHNKLLYHLL